MFDEIIGNDLAGWHLEKWYELRLPTDERGTQSKIDGYFTDRDLALAAGSGRGAYGDSGIVAEIIVLTPDSKIGYAIESGQIVLSDEEKIRTELIQKAKNKLSEEELRLLGL